MAQVDFHSGDSVRFLNETGSGKVKGILTNGMVMVETEDGFEYPVHPNQLVIVAKAEKPAMKPQHTPAPPVEPVKPQTPGQETNSKTGVTEKPADDRIRFCLAFTTKETTSQGLGNSVFELHLINDSEYEMLYQVFKTDDTGTRNIGHGSLDAGYIEELLVFDRDAINLLKKITVQAIFVGRFGMRMRQPVEKVLKFEPFVFFIPENFSGTEYFDEPAMLLDIINETGFDEDVLHKLDELQQSLNNKELPGDDFSARYQSRKKPETIEVDLHINALLDNVKGMTNAEILDYQMQHFHKTITDAMFKKAGRVVFIHGIGNGTLRDKLRDSLKTHYKLNFQDASFQEYGFGATMVFLNAK